MNFQIGAYYNALRPEFGSTWQLRTQITLIFQGRFVSARPIRRANRMEPAWGASWLWGLSLITLTTAFHAFGIVMIFRGFRQRIRTGKMHDRHFRHPILHAIALIAVVGLLLTVLHGIEAAMWTAAYLLLGAVGSERDAMLYSLDSFTTRGASDVLLAPEWRLMGALEAADGMLLFGISTAFVFAIFQRVIVLIDHYDEGPRRPLED